MTKIRQESGKYKAADVAQAVGVSTRMVRFYVEQKLLPPPLARGSGRVYTEQHVVGLRAIRALRAQKLYLRDIHARLRKASAEDLVAIGNTLPTPANQAPAPDAKPATAEGSASPCPSQRWDRIELLPGLELHVRADGGPLLARLAEEIHARYAVKT